MNLCLPIFVSLQNTLRCHTYIILDAKLFLNCNRSVAIAAFDFLKTNFFVFHNSDLLL